MPCLPSPPERSPAPLSAQGKFPDRPIRLIVPWPPGGSADAQLRSLAELSSKTLGQPVLVENRPGASGTLGAQFLTTQAKPDGYTLAQMHMSIVRRPYIVRTPPWDAVADFTHIIGLCGWMYGIAVKADGPIKSWADFLAYARANPGRLTYATSGIATTNHLAMEELAAREKIELVHVPYRAANESAVAVASGEVMCVADASSWAPLVEGGQLRLLCAWTAERSPRFPDAPTLRELGYDMVITSPYGISGPKGMDPGVDPAAARRLQGGADGPGQCHGAGAVRHAAGILPDCRIPAVHRPPRGIRAGDGEEAEPADRLTRSDDRSAAYARKRV